MHIENIDILFVPGLAFDLRGYRIGYGGGHYDRLLEKLPATCLTIGFAFDFQVIAETPALPHDRPVDWLITDQRIANCKKNRR